MDQFDIVEVAKRTADSMGELVVKLAQRVKELESENEELKHKLGNQADDFK